jgi:phosphatidylglycerophosphatase A
MWIWVAAGLVPAVWAAEETRRSIGREDPQIVVIDEVLGQWLTMAALPGWTVPGMLAALILFRAFDIIKPWPVRRFEDLPGGWGIVADDLMAGLYGATAILVLRPLL